tara:strand:+ start:5385 stop:6071 length:687 start_codon:yes stop_codon:yes gene_type:complete
MNEVINLLRSRSSVRKFTNQNIPQDTLDELIKCGQAAATSSFIQACTVIQLEDSDKRNLLADLAGGQPYVASASRFLVFCADMNRHQLVCDMHNSEMISGYTEQFITATVDVALFAQNVMTAAQSLGIEGVYIGGIRNNIAEVSNLLELPTLVYPVFGIWHVPRLPCTRTRNQTETTLISRLKNRPLSRRQRYKNHFRIRWTSTGILSKPNRRHKRNNMERTNCKHVS